VVLPGALFFCLRGGEMEKQTPKEKALFKFSRYGKYQAAVLDLALRSIYGRAMTSEDALARAYLDQVAKRLGVPSWSRSFAAVLGDVVRRLMVRWADEDDITLRVLVKKLASRIKALEAR